MRKIWQLIRDTVSRFGEHECARMAAAMAYYTIFSLPALLLMIIFIAGAIWGEDAVRGQLSGQLQQYMGPQAAEFLQEMISKASMPNGGGLSMIISLGVLIFGATRAFAELQRALNQTWWVQPAPDTSVIKDFALKRLMSFLIVVVMALLLVALLVASALLTAMGDRLEQYVPSQAMAIALQVANWALQIGVLVLLFFALFMILPDAKIAKKNAFIGAIFTTFLFLLGVVGLGLLMTYSDPGSAYGAAGSLAIVLIWLYYVMLIVLLGSEFTAVYATLYGEGVHPDKRAVRYKRVTVDEERGHDERPAR